MTKDFSGLWPLFTKPKEDELLTSWMMRNAHNHLQKVYTFYRREINFSEQEKAKVWIIDLDKNPRLDVLEIMSRRTGMSRKEVFDTTLRYYEGRLIENYSYGNVRWFLPIGHYHTKNNRHNLLYCPQCLVNDKVPYFRKRWKLSLSFCCPKCCLILRETCWECGSGINFIRTELGDKSNHNINRMTTCISVRQT